MMVANYAYYTGLGSTGLAGSLLTGFGTGAVLGSFILMAAAAGLFMLRVLSPILRRLGVFLSRVLLCGAVATALAVTAGMSLANAFGV